MHSGQKKSFADIHFAAGNFKKLLVTAHMPHNEGETNQYIALFKKR